MKMSGDTRRFLPPRSVAPRIRGAKLRRRQAPVEPVPVVEPAEEPETETAPGEVDTGTDSESDFESSTVSPGQAPAPTQAPALDGSKTSERVIPTLTPITHAPRPIPPIFAGEDPQKGDKEITRTGTSSLAFPTERPDTDDERYTRPGGVGAGLQPSPTTENPAVVTGSKGLIESGDKDGDGLSVVQNPPARGGLSAGAKAGIAVGTIAGVALFAGLLFFLWRWKRSRKGHRLADDPPELPYSSPNNLIPGLSATVDPRSNSQILDDLIAASYAHQNGNTAPGGGAWSAQDEKRDMEAAHIANLTPQSRQIEDPQPQIRFSIASWLRRHHPLKLNPLGSKRGSMASSAATSNVSRAKKSAPPAPSTVRDSSATSILDVKTMMRPRYHDSIRPNQSVSQRNTFATEVTNSVYDYYARPESQPQGGLGIGGEVIPPLPPVVTAPGQTKTQQLAAKYQSVWSDSTGTTTSGASGASRASGITASSGAIPIGVQQDMTRNVNSVWTDQSGGTSVLYMYENAASSGQRPTTGLTNLTTASSAYPGPLQKSEDPLPVSPLSPVGQGNMNGAGYGTK
ncbi:hypothetical protein V8F20_003002 [Naviculisporaceae sp. PSN 640]